MVAEYPAGHPAAGAAEEPDRQVPADRAPAAPEAEDAAGPADFPQVAATARVVEFAVRTAPAPGGDAVPGAEDDDSPAAPAAATDEVADGPEETTAPTPAEDGAEAASRRLGRRRDRRGPNKREVRHQQTREAIVDAAAALFGERGFDHVSVLEIAQRAGVVEKTVFNHFPVKEGLVFEADPPMRAALLEAVRHRPAGESVAAAAGGFVVAAISQLGAPAAATGVAEMARVVRGSRTLQTREREILGTLTETLAEQITVETRPADGDLEPWLAANAVLGLYSALLELARDRVLAGASGPELVQELQTRGQRGLALLQFGLAGYAKRR
ncbi:MAG: Transcriptional regulator, TetR family [Modestobacter sp.]|nr:Transcriptional regulator, TetR family [Modestobacter sp.]